jgi:hypothetical protein
MILPALIFKKMGRMGASAYNYSFTTFVHQQIDQWNTNNEFWTLLFMASDDKNIFNNTTRLYCGPEHFAACALTLYPENDVKKAFTTIFEWADDMCSRVLRDPSLPIPIHNGRWYGEQQVFNWAAGTALLQHVNKNLHQACWELPLRNTSLEFWWITEYHVPRRNPGPNDLPMFWMCPGRESTLTPRVSTYHIARRTGHSNVYGTVEVRM